jgi:hypothetical protein
MRNRPGTVTLVWTTSFLALAVVLRAPNAPAASDEARVTRIVRDVKLLPSEAKPKPAVLNDKVSDGTGVRTGDQSRSELTFLDLTIERLGANTVFSFNRGGRSVRLNNGSMLLRVPKDSGGADMTTTAVTVGITGTTVILETRAGRNKLIVLEGGARVSLNQHKGESVYVRGGQMEDVPAGASKLPRPVNINLPDLMKKHPLITDFAALPSRDLIMATAENPPAAYGEPVEGEPTRSGPGFIPGILGVGLGPILGGGGGGGGGRHIHTGSSGGNTKGSRDSANHSSGNANTGASNQQRAGYKKNPHTNAANPTPTPSRKKKPGTGTG